MSKFILNFKEITKKDVALAGGKGASLGEMTNAKIPVPPGFVVTASAFDRFLEETDLNVEIAAFLDKIDYQNIKTVERTSRMIRDMIAKSSMPKDLVDLIVVDFKKLKSPYVAVRSSATAEDSSTASWAGELETYLNTTEKDLVNNVRKCWSSLFTPRAIFYRNEKGLVKSKVSVAVVVQAMIQSEAAGITFTVHPVTEDPNQMIIETGWGLGEAVVSGQITPDSYVVDKKDGVILDINITEQSKMLAKKGVKTGWVAVPKNKQNKQKLSNKEIMEVAKICAKIEKHYGFPCDIEWAAVGGKIYITQSRPITTLK